ncbi:hypothetical protein DEQ92_07630 [Haloferax sp. Atlit-6N]|uniref:hypothetical protein n=1 Tax=unclassified Haloferax TaxID=2625095 RepID=UPI000E2482A4|nr:MULTISPECIES: hypothetical protein [unclassified Haloferax]RDZ54227.1 hypothetical protein C5C07_01450 [Haloferax sp. Atlit-4N]REA06117.1 hypothetical protein DEQ92_07630 [Haloferax sp. Atlit-6N]
MNRRAYLATAGALFLAGCSSADGGETTTEEPTTTTATPTATETPTTTTTEEPTTTTEEPTTETTTEEPDRVDRILGLAVEDLDAAVDDFASVAGEDGGFHDLNATTQFSFEDDADSLYLARGHFNTLDQLDKTDAQRARLGRLRRAFWFLWWTGKTHENANQAFYRTNNAVSRLYGEEFNRIDTQVQQIAEALEPTRDTLNSLRKESEADALDELTALEPADYGRKVDFFEREIGQFEAFADDIVSFRDAIRRLQDGFDEYLGESYGDATGSFFRAMSAFEDVNARVSERDPVAAIASRSEEFACLTDAMARASEVLDEAATAGDNDIPEKQTALESEAREAFADCDLVAEHFTFVADFFEELPDERS